jgi:hypothetical protein
LHLPAENAAVIARDRALHHGECDLLHVGSSKRRTRGAVRV